VITTLLFPETAELISVVPERLFRGEKVAILSEDEVTLNEAAVILGDSAAVCSNAGGPCCP
jgi:hypothetical protein